MRRWAFCRDMCRGFECARGRDRTASVSRAWAMRPPLKTFARRARRTAETAGNREDDMSVSPIKAEQNPSHLSNSFFSASLRDVDPEIMSAIDQELGRQREEIELIASENIVSQAVLEAQGSVMTNKYAEGYPGRRYYAGCQFVDIAEKLAIEARLQAVRLQLRQCPAQFRQPGQSGGSFSPCCSRAIPSWVSTSPPVAILPTGAPVNVSGKWFNVVGYNVRPEDQRIDMDEVARLAHEHKPKLIIAGGSAYPRHWDFARFREIADEIGAYFLVDMAHFAGLVAGGVHPSPFPHAHVATTTTHKTLRGPRGGHDPLE